MLIDFFDTWTLLGPLRLVLPSVTPVLLAAGYAATIIVLVEFSPMHNVLNIVAPLGRMACTNYILQSMILGFVFLGYGLGQFGRLAATPALLLGVALYVSQVMFSGLWLQRYRFGPLEWLWRTLMYGKAQPMAR